MTLILNNTDQENYKKKIVLKQQRTNNFTFMFSPLCRLKCVNNHKFTHTHTLSLSLSHTHTHTHTCACARMDTHTQMHKCMHTHTHIHTHTYKCVHASTQTHTCTSAHIHAPPPPYTHKLPTQNTHLYILNTQADTCVHTLTLEAHME